VKNLLRRRPFAELLLDGLLLPSGHVAVPPKDRNLLIRMWFGSRNLCRSRTRQPPPALLEGRAKVRLSQVHRFWGPESPVADRRAAAACDRHHVGGDEFSAVAGPTLIEDCGVGLSDDNPNVASAGKRSSWENAGGSYEGGEGSARK